MKEPRFPDSRLGHHGDDLAVPGERQCKRPPHLGEFAFASNKLGQRHVESWKWVRSGPSPVTSYMSMGSLRPLIWTGPSARNSK
jgi:hypothetical protein